MRMWLINPKCLCRKHLLGEHLEMHMFAGSIKKGINVQGYIDKGLLNPDQIESRHNELVKEMENRGFKHKSPIKVESSFLGGGCIDIEANIKDLKIDVRNVNYNEN